MATLSQYTSFSEKEEQFIQGGSKILRNIDLVFERLDTLHKNGDFIFRGLSEAKYKLFNSAQRYYINYELYKQVDDDDIEMHYDDFVGNLIDECKSWNTNTVQKLLNAALIDENNSLAYLSYMQHFGVPTPLLDFTFNPYLALFFAVDNISFTPSNNDIDNYFSIYYTYHNNIIFEGWKETFSLKNNTDNGNKLTYDVVSRSVLQVLLPNEDAYKILNNTNIINQEGLFIYNSIAFGSLEELYLEHVNSVRESLIARLGQEEVDKLLILEKFAACINIHKSLIPYIKDRLLNLGITKEFVYPDTYKMRETVVSKAAIRALSRSADAEGTEQK